MHNAHSPLGSPDCGTLSQDRYNLFVSIPLVGPEMTLESTIASIRPRRRNLFICPLEILFWQTACIEKSLVIVV